MAAAAPTLPALLKALRQSSSGAAVSTSTMEQAFDFLIATSSLSDTQSLYMGLKHNQPSKSWYEKLQQAAAICTEPSSKAEYLGFVLLQASVCFLETTPVSTEGQVLLQIFHANNGVLPGYLAALLARDGPLLDPNISRQQAHKILTIVAPVLQSVLIDNSVTEKYRVAVFDAMTRIVGHFDGHWEDNPHPVWTSFVHMLVQALELVPYVQFLQSTYVVHVKIIIDLLRTHRIQSNELLALAKRTALVVLESIHFVIQKDDGVVTLLQSLELLASAVPQACWSSIFLTSAAYFLVVQCHTPFEQQWMLQILDHALEFGRRTDGTERRSVYVEMLVLPLSSIRRVHGNAVSKLLRLVMAIKSTSSFVPTEEAQDVVYPTETATHAHLAIEMLGCEETCQQWLSCLLESEKTASTNVPDPWVALLLVALLSDERSALCGRAADCLERLVTKYPKYWGPETTKAIVASLIFLVSHQPSHKVPLLRPVRRLGAWMTSCLYSLAALAARTTDTMRMVLRLIESMNGTPTMRPMALTLLYQVWQNESRVFPKLETMLREATGQDKELERQIVTMSVIKALCEKDPDLGVQFIALIQVFLEDKLPSVVAMAMDAITALCRGDCLDFYVAFKIIAQKLRKKKVTCIEEALFQERLCGFYALGGADYAAHKSQVFKLSTQLWTLAANQAVSVRREAYKALSQLPLDMIGLSMPIGEPTGQDGDDEEGMREEEVEEQVDDLLEQLQNESDVSVRLEIEKLVAKVMEQESTKLSAGVGRGQRMESTASGGPRRQQQVSLSSGTGGSAVSATATKELKVLLPSRSEVENVLPSTSCSSSWSAFLLAYQPKTLIDVKNVTRKDKLVRLATQNVDELVTRATHVLESLEVPWNSSDDDDASSYHLVLRIQVLMEGWRGFMATYVSSLDKLAELKTPAGMDDANVALRVFSEHVGTFLDLLLNGIANKVGGTVAAGALVGTLCESRHWLASPLRLQYDNTVTELVRRLALSMEQARVFTTEKQDARVRSLGAVIALELSLGRRNVDTSADCSTFCLLLDKIEQLLIKLYHNKSDNLLSSSALIGLSHIATIFSNGNELESFETLQWRHKRIQPIAQRLLDSFLQLTRAQEPKTSFVSHGNVLFPLLASPGAPSSMEAIVAECKECSSPDDKLLRWAALMGLARLSSRFASIQRLDWLQNVHQLLMAVWKQNTSEKVVAVALGPVLMQCAHLNVTPSSSLEQFLTTCTQRAAIAVESSAMSVESGFIMMAAANVLCHFDSCGGFQEMIQEQTELLIQLFKNNLDTEKGADENVKALLVCGLANFFHCSFGLYVAKSSVETKIEVTLGFEAVKTVVDCIRQAASHCGIAKAMLGAIARASDGFYVSQKKKSFDVELRALPSTTLLVKVLDGLRQANPLGNSSYHQETLVLSVLRCLISTGTVLPLLDYASLTRRVMFRFGSVDVSIACIRFAATQGSCDDVVVRDLFSPDWFGTVNAALQIEMMAWLAVAATRLPTNVLQSLLVQTFELMKDLWRRDTLLSSPHSRILFDGWTAMLSELLEPKPRRALATSSVAMVHTFLLDKVLIELPFDIHASFFVEQFARRVLSKVDNCQVDTLLKAEVVTASLWSWWRSGVFIVELAHLDVLTVSKRESALIFQWILRHDFQEWKEENLVTMYLQPLLARIGALIARHTKPADYVSSLLDVIDVVSGSLASSLSCQRLNPKDIGRCRALLNVVASVLSWNSMQSFETHLLHLSRSKLDKMKTAMELLPFGLIACESDTKTVVTLGERLWILLKQLDCRNEHDLVEYTGALQRCSQQIYLTADSWPIPSAMSAEIREFWSMKNTKTMAKIA